MTAEVHIMYVQLNFLTVVYKVKLTLQRTLTNKDGVEKKPVTKGQEVLVYLSLVDNKPFFEISSGSSDVDSADDIMAALGL